MVGFFRKTLSVVSALLLLFSCGKRSESLLFDSPNLKIQQLTDNVFLHVSYIETNDFGRVKCNGAIFRNSNEVVILDTPTNDIASMELIQWIKQEMKSEIVSVVPTHHHDDCLGGIAAFDRNGIKSYAHKKTIQLAQEDSILLTSVAFDDQITFKIGQEEILVSFFGQGHTYDNVVAYYPSEKTLFGGCLVKSVGAGKGFLGDADTLSWSTTVQSIQSAYKDISLVIPGHGKPGNKELLDYTSTMFETGSE